ncbi:MAG: hypothetical protein QOG80_1324 [Pseudonocardiales bacterium]|nr:hypothetical protein [Pseudonocardiales bacterium]
MRIVATRGADTAEFPVVKEAGSWKVCLSRSGIAATTAPTASDLPPGLQTDTSSASTATSPTGIPTDLALCAQSTSGYAAASIYVSAAETGIAGLAQSCVYQHSVPASITDSLAGKFFAPQTTDTTAGDITYVSIDGTTVITVHTDKEPGCRYYVVGVTTG